MKDDPKLRELLRASHPNAQVPNDFGAEVWQRIQVRSEESENRGWARFFEPLFTLVMRPAFAAVLIATALGGAVGAASLRASNVNEQARAELAERHVATLDPYARMMANR